MTPSIATAKITTGMTIHDWLPRATALTIVAMVRGLGGIEEHVFAMMRVMPATTIMRLDASSHCIC